MLEFIFNLKYNKGDKRMKTVKKIFTFIFYKSERKLPKIKIELMKL